MRERNAVSCQLMELLSLLFPLLLLLHIEAIKIGFTSGVASIWRNTLSPHPSAPKTAPYHKVKGDQQFLSDLEHFRRKLYPERSANDEQWEEGTDRTSLESLPKNNLVIKWHPVECKTMGLEVNVKKGRLVSGKRHEGNSVYRIKHEDGEEYAYKLFGNSEHYVAELIFLMSIGNANKHFSQAVCIQRENGGKGKVQRGGILLRWVKGGRSSSEYARHPHTTSQDLQKITAQTFLLLKQIHELGFVHADLKADNILIDGEGRVVIIDFGYTQLVANLHRSRGNRAIRAPELNELVKAPISEAIDMWAFGMVVAGWYGWSGLGLKHDYKMIYNGKKVTFGKIPTTFPVELRQLLWILTNPEPDKRRLSSIEEKDAFKKLPFFDGVDWNNVI